MANTINDLYLKYVNKVGRSLENDRYFRYLFEMAQAGSTELQQRNQVLHKVVDERWLSTIEESLDSIFKIIDKPRRFVTTEEEVVPVALAKKITADSVRHLSQNTQFIAPSDDGSIHPTRILNVSTTESFDLYENRFIYHLIQRLVSFIDKRTDVIFWSTGDETRNVLNMNTTVEDAYETIEYKLEMTVKNRQSFAENDSDNMQVFMRIDRVRRMVIALRNSSFCSLMAGCAKVRSPIQRTNLMMKDPDYRTCYKLWQFLESYDEVGYTIDVKEKALEFDEEYLIQLYTNLITNYTVFKSLLEADPRKLEEAPARRHRVIKPKFIKQIKEEIVDDYDLPDVEIRQVIIEEVTQAQLDAEAALEAEKAHTKELEEALEDADERVRLAIQQMNTAVQQSVAAEARASEAEQIRAEAEAAAQEAQAARDTALEERDAALADAAEAHQARAAAEADAARVLRETEAETARVRAEAAEQVSRAQSEAAEQITQTRDEAEKQISDARNEAAKQIAETTDKAEKQLAEAQRLMTDAEEKARKAESARAEAQEQQHAAAAAQEEAHRLVTEAQEARAAAETETARVKEETTAEITRMRDEAVAEVTRIREKATAEIDEAQRARTEAESLARNEVSARKKAEQQQQQALQAMQEAQEARRAAEQAKISAEREQTLARKEKTAAEKVAESESKARREAEARAEKARKTAQTQVEEATRARKIADEAAAAHAAARAAAEETATQALAARSAAEETLRTEQQARSQAEQRLNEALARLEQESRARQKAQEKADANSLSKYIVSRLRGQRDDGEK